MLTKTIVNLKVKAGEVRFLNMASLGMVFLEEEVCQFILTKVWNQAKCTKLSKK